MLLSGHVGGILVLVPWGRRLWIWFLGSEFAVNLSGLDVSMTFYFDSHVIFEFLASGVVLMHEGVDLPYGVLIAARPERLRSPAYRRSTASLLWRFPDDLTRGLHAFEVRVWAINRSQLLPSIFELRLEARRYYGPNIRIGVLAEQELVIGMLDGGVVVQLFRQRRAPSPSLPEDSLRHNNVLILTAQLPREDFLPTFDASPIFCVICSHETLRIVVVVSTLYSRSIHLELTASIDGLVVPDCSRTRHQSIRIQPGEFLLGITALVIILIYFI